jgi:hypothetical protein
MRFNVTRNQDFTMAGSLAHDGVKWDTLRSLKYHRINDDLRACRHTLL